MIRFSRSSDWVGELSLVRAARVSASIVAETPFTKRLVSRDKLLSLQILSRHHIGIPRTTFVRDKKDVLPGIERFVHSDRMIDFH